MSYLPIGLEMTPAGFAMHASKGKWKCPPHLALMSKVAMQVAFGEILHQMTLEPPQTGKSMFWSKWFPVWYLGWFPEKRIILGSYNADYAAKWGGIARDCMEEFGEEYFGLKVRQDQRSKDDWSISGQGGGMRTMGMDGGITGHPAELFLIDDPFKGAVDALSPACRENVWNIFTSCVDSRIQPGGATCITFTPWHPDDLGGRLLANKAYPWNILRMPALAEEPIDAETRATREGYDALIGAPDPLGRKPGEALWPSRFGVAHYERKRTLEGFWFDAIYQCQPRPRDGGIFKRDWFDGKIIAATHRESRRVRAWDTAASDGKGDWTVGVLMGEHNGMFYVEHVERFQLGPGARDARIRDIATLDKARFGYEVSTWVERSGGGGGVTEAAGIVKHLAGFDINEEPATTGKEYRATPFAAQCQAGNVKIVAGDWVEKYLDELCSFIGKGSAHDDQVDASSLAFAKLALGEESGGYVSVSDAEYLEYEAMTAGAY